jgi:hypothetical protein
LFSFFLFFGLDAIHSRYYKKSFENKIHKLVLLRAAAAAIDEALAVATGFVIVPLVQGRLRELRNKGMKTPDDRSLRQ